MSRNADYLLVDEGTRESVELPAQPHLALRQIVATLRAGQAVTVYVQAMTLSTQQAANLLHVSRPTVVKLIEAGELPCDRTSRWRKLRLDDVLAYRDRHRR